MRYSIKKILSFRQLASAATCLIVLLYPHETFAHRWNMRTYPFEGGTNDAACASNILILADRINDKMEALGYLKGQIATGRKAVRIDGVGYKQASMYLYCSEFSMYIFTSHTPVDDDKFFSDLYNTMLAEFQKIRRGQ